MGDRSTEAFGIIRRAVLRGNITGGAGQMDFTHAVYEQLLDGIKKAGYQVITVREFLEGNRKPFTLVLRHDVEWDPRRALAIAEIEKAHGVRSTFYFRVDTKAFDLAIMRYLQDEGFEVGYHFNTLDRCGGNFDRAIALFENDLQQLRGAGIEVKTVCSHGDPRVKKVGYKVNNEIFLRDPNLRARNRLRGEAYLDIDFSCLQYLSDVGVRWAKAGSTKEVISRIARKEWPIVYILTHPDYWSRSPFRAGALLIASKLVRSFRINRAIIVGKDAVAFFLRMVRKADK